jgi:uncharacterized protein HemX
VDQKKQKMLLAVLAVLVLGAGSYYFVFRGDGSGNQDFTAQGPAGRKKSAQAEEKTVERRKATKKDTSEAPKTVERKSREESESTTVERKKRRNDKKEEKKKTVSPAA